MTHNLFSLVMAHPLIFGLGAYYIFAAVVDSLDEPTDKSTKLYRKTYRILHFLAANIKKSIAAKLNIGSDPSSDPNAQGQVGQG
jgi:hypothetical protein